MPKTKTLDSLTAIGACDESVAWVKERGLYDGQQAWDAVDWGQWLLHWLASCVKENGTAEHKRLINAVGRTLVICMPLGLVGDPRGVIWDWFCGLDDLNIDSNLDNDAREWASELGITSISDLIAQSRTIKLTDEYDVERARLGAAYCLAAIVRGTDNMKERCDTAALAGVMVALSFPPRVRGRTLRTIADIVRSEVPEAPWAPGVKAVEEAQP